MSTFWVHGSSELRKAIRPHIEELEREIDSLADLRNLPDNSVEKNRSEPEIREEYSEYAALMCECRESLY